MSFAVRRLVAKKKFSVARILTLRTFSSGTDEENVLCSDLTVDIPNQTISEFVYSKIEPFSKYTAVECPLTGRSFTFDQVRVKSRNVAKSLRKKLKLQKGEVVAVYLTNCPEYPIATLGILEAGLMVTTLNPLYTPDEIARQFKDAQPKAVITQNDLYPKVKSALEKIQQNIPIIWVKTKDGESVPQGAINFDEFANEQVDYPDIQPGDANDVACLPYSSGTTGLPKGVLLSHRNIVSNACMLLHPECRMTVPPTDDHQDIVPAVLPMFHIYGFNVNMISMLVTGAKILPLPKFTPDSYISCLKNYDVTLIYAAPPLVLFLTAHPDVTPDTLKSVKFVMSGAAPLGVSDEKRFLEKAGIPIFMLQGYGLTETGPVVAAVQRRFIGSRECGGSIGAPLPNTKIKIVGPEDPTGKALGPNQTGELWAQGPQVMIGYHNRPEETRNTLTQDGWIKTGDVAYYNEDGLLFVTDRLKELIKVKGFQVPPAELEEVVRSYPDVSDAAVVGIPHPTQGEVPKAFVVPKANKVIDIDKLYGYVSEKVAPYKQLKGGIEIVESIPKNSSGKILRRELRLKYVDQQ